LNFTLFEKVNKEKLIEVLECNNIPFEESDDREWKSKFKEMLFKYTKLKETEKGIPVEYYQKYNYGRMYSKIGLQGFQREVRKYIAGEYYIDLDFVNCHLVILQQLFEKNEIVCPELLKEYNKDRSTFFSKYHLSGKVDMIKIIYNNENKRQDFNDFHNKLYKNLVPKLIKENKQVYLRIQKERRAIKKDYNISGSFLSMYLQNIEHEMLLILYKELTNKDLTIGAFMFDGLYVLKDPNFSEDILINVKNRIKHLLGYEIDIILKPTETNWKPEKGEDNIINLFPKIDNENGNVFSKQVCRKLFLDCFDDNKKVIQNFVPFFMNYLNDYICVFDYPHSYGWRRDTNKLFEQRKKMQLCDRIGIKEFEFWNSFDDQLSFERCSFVVDKEDSKFTNERIYNTYKRPKTIEFELLENETYDQGIERVCPTFFDFLLRIISNGNVLSFIFLKNYISKMVQVGKTGILIALMGKMGCGKSTFVDLLRLIIGDEYFQKVDDINQLNNNFNGEYERAIITSIEELTAESGEFHRVQNKLKTLVTETKIKIERKGIDSYMSESLNNYILCTNNNNPVAVNSDNRRSFITKISSKEQRNTEYFSKLYKEVKSNVEYLRYYFNTFNYTKDLNSIRPKTEAEQDVLELNLNFTEKFIEELNLDFAHAIQLNDIYIDYKEYIKENDAKKMDKRYFVAELKKKGYKIKKNENDIEIIINQ
jgi:energy-coupling factor transporter ATP-binding protein EcfA2